MLRKTAALLLFAVYGVGGHGLHLIGDFHHDHGAGSCASHAHGDHDAAHRHAVCAHQSDASSGVRSATDDAAHACPICQWQAQPQTLLVANDVPAHVEITPRFIVRESQRSPRESAAGYRSRAPPSHFSQLG